MKRLFIAAAAAAVFSCPAYAGETREARLSAAQDYIEMTLLDIDMQALIQQMWKPLIAQVEASGRTISEEQIQRVDTLYQSNLTEPMYDIMRQQDEIMADLFTLTEIEALRDFYASEEGRAVMRKLPMLLERQQPQIMSMVEAQMPEVLPQVLEILELD